MPHVIIEYSANVAENCSIQALVDSVHKAAESHPLTPDHALRTRASGRDHYRIADGDQRYAFVSITARIGTGRSQSMKDDYQTLLIDTAEAFLAANAPELITAFSVETQEIDGHRENRNQIRTHALRHKTKGQN